MDSIFVQGQMSIIITRASMAESVQSLVGKIGLGLRGGNGFV